MGILWPIKKNHDRTFHGHFMAILPSIIIVNRLCRYLKILQTGLCSIVHMDLISQKLEFRIWKCSYDILYEVRPHPMWQEMSLRTPDPSSAFQGASSLHMHQHQLSILIWTTRFFAMHAQKNLIMCRQCRVQKYKVPVSLGSPSTCINEEECEIVIRCFVLCLCIGTFSCGRR